MKQWLFISMLLLFSGCRDRTKSPVSGPDENTDTATFVFQEEFHNFGSLQAGEIAAYSFCLKNTGTKALRIEDAQSDCGCITVEYPKEEVSPGDSVYVDILFNSAGETGRLYKEVAIITHAAGSKIKKDLAIVADVRNDRINIYKR
ncbi:MAG: DUF1573 domain-containing protein [Mangrovibacterium sp.]|nr:DUF1573 domain-containing protein [Mangrovibacterium sp.]